MGWVTVQAKLKECRCGSKRFDVNNSIARSLLVRCLYCDHETTVRVPEEHPEYPTTVREVRAVLDDAG